LRCAPAWPRHDDRGDRIVLRAVGAADLPVLYRLLGDVSLQGDHLALPLRSEPSFRKEFDETGFLDRRRGRFLVTDFDDRMLGTIVYFDVNYMDGFSVTTCSMRRRVARA
jgi:hypothetical protein